MFSASISIGDGKMDQLQRQQEEQHLAAVLDLIRSHIQAVEREIDDTRDQNAALAANLWEEGHHMIYDFDDVVEYQQYATELALHDHWLQRSRGSLRMLRKMLQSPYFGRIDFAAASQNQPAQIYIGVHSLTAPGKFRPCVYDWRAPVCSMFYDYGIGPASYTSPSGEIHGVISLKRQYKITDGAFEYLLDSDLTIDDAILQKELSLHSESRLRTIISSIQREQNAAIRHNTGEDLLVFGAAGSGKTSIGLHRLAYHLYQARGSISSQNVLIFAQSDVFHSYIADIIPELGEQDVRRLSFSQLIREQFGMSKTPLDPCELTEHFLRAQDDDRVEGVRAKYAADFLDFLQERVHGLRIGFEDIRVFRETVCAGETLTARYTADHKFRPFTRLNRLCAYAQDRIDDFFTQRAAEIKVWLLAEMVDAKDVDSEYDRLLQSTRDRARQRLFAQANLDAEGLYLRLLRAYGQERRLNPALYEGTAGRLACGSLPFEDALVMLYIRLLTGELEADRTIRHVLIDEAQDFSVLQHRIIRGLTANSKYTVLADPQQAMFPVLNLQDQAQLQALYGGTVMELTKSYRSTRPISDLAAKLLERPKGEAFNRDGSKPRLLRGADTAACVLRALDMPECRASASVGILTKTVEQARALHAGLGRADIGLLASSDHSFRAGTLILPVSLAKGLEFDCVILPDCTEAAFHTAQDKRILYLMCTRALHHLFLVCNGQLTEFLAPYADLMEEVI